MAGPWEEYQPKPWTEYPSPAAQRSSGPRTPKNPDEGWFDYFKRLNAVASKQATDEGYSSRFTRDLASAGKLSTPVVRGAINAVNSIPVLAQDLGVGTRNLLTGSDYQLPSQMYQQAIDQTFPRPNVPGAGALELGTSMLLGAKFPTPQISNPAPAGFVKPAADAVRQQTLEASRRAGYVVPPSTTNPTAVNTFLESFGGKIATAQDAAIRNQEVTNTLAKRALGLTEDAPITQESLAALRREAGKAYETLRGVGAVSLDDASTKTLDDIAGKFTGSKLKEALGGGNDIPKIVQAIKDESLTGDTAVDVIALLRDKADVAYRAGESQIGKAYKGISTAIENLMERNLSGAALTSFREARQLIAKTRTVEGAFNPSTGNVVANKLAAQLGKGKPLTDELRTAAQFGQAFPKAAQEMVDSGAVRNTDAILGSGAAVFTGHPWYLGWPFLRQGARSLLLSEAGQGMATPTIGAGANPEVVMGLLTGAESLRKQ